MDQARKQESMVLMVGTIGLLLMLDAKNSDALAEEKRQAQSTTTVCDEDTDSCEISVCDDPLLFLFLIFDPSQEVGLTNI